MNIFKSAVTGFTTWVGKTIGGAVGGPTGAAIGEKLGSAVSGLFEKKPGADKWSPISTAVKPPSFSGYTEKTSYPSGEGRGPDVRLTTVDAETLNAEWEYRLTKGLRNRNLFT